MAKGGGTTRTNRYSSRPLFTAKNSASSSDAMSRVSVSDINRVNSVLSNALKGTGINKDNATISFSDGQFNVYGPGIDIRREYDSMTGEMIHRKFIIDEDLRGKGLSKKFHKAMMPIYDKLGVKKITLQASQENGGYTWARYGFTAPREDAKGILLDSPRMRPYYKEAKKIFNDFYETHSESTRFPMNLWADKSWGRDALSGSSWHGELDLTDKKQRKRYIDYIS